MIKTILEDVADNLFNPDPYYQQGGDMVRVGGLTYACTPAAVAGSRITDMRLNGKPLEAGQNVQGGGLGARGSGQQKCRAAGMGGGRNLAQGQSHGESTCHQYATTHRCRWQPWFGLSSPWRVAFAQRFGH
jgi:2',3'-cyclic-nucleotide 2'-phosphodiesterase (5'-nucleotidase family)